RPEGGLYGGGDFYGTVPLEPRDAYAGAQLRVTLLPRVAERLVEGGMPPSRIPLALGLVLINGLLMWIAVSQLRRGHELVSLRERFIRNVSHELRTPLQQILLFTELLRSGGTRGAVEDRKALDIVHGEVQRLIELVKNLLRFSDPAETRLSMEPVALAPLVREVVEAFRPMADAGGAVLEVRGGSGARVRADIDALRRVLVNLLDNAVKYGPGGQCVLVEDGESEGWGFVAVSDQGPGIPDDEADQIWEAFQRLERDQRGPTAGSGIGLAIVRRLVSAMGGEVGVGEAEGGGSRFVVKLPLDPGQ
ncbi:MAG: HAMP domain-containing histidine kinase, partial [Gemmatimonadota bacterium]|nr:HAMP domain-containing histidine kinase [Gemmatimonadota bacterium]